MMPSGWRVRPARFNDAEAMLAIEQRAHSHPWSRKQFEEILDSDHAVWVLEDADARCMGYAVLMLAVDDTDLLNIAIEPQYRRRGLGRLILREVLDRVRERGALRCFLEVRVSNIAAIALYRREGFTEVGRRRDYYPSRQGREDALVMCLELSGEEKA